MKDSTTNSANFYVYLNIEPLATAWAAYRGLMCSSSTVGSKDFRPLAYWPFGLLRRAARGDDRSLRRLEKEIAIEQVRREYYTEKVSRLHGIYLWKTRDDAVRGERWRGKEGQHFISEQLSEIEFYYSNLTEADTQWIDHHVLDDDYRLDRSDLTWAHKYWSGERWDDNPHWEQLVEGRGIIRTTSLRQRALEKITAEFPRLLGEAELARLAAELGSDLNSISPYVFRSRPDILSSAFCVDVKDDNEPFMRKIGHHIRSLDKTLVNWQALNLLRAGIKHTADLTREGFDFNLNLLSDEGRSGISDIASPHDGHDWSGVQIVST